MINEIPVAFHKDSNYDYHFMIKKSENEFQRQFEYLWENKGKFKTFSVLIKKETTKIDKDGYESIETISYKIKFIDSLRFMATSLSNFVDNLMEGIHKIKYKDCGCFLEYENVNDNLIKYKYLSCNKEYSKNWGKCLDLYLRRDVLLLAYVFENFINMCINISELDPANILLAPGIEWQTALKRQKQN